MSGMTASAMSASRAFITKRMASGAGEEQDVLDQVDQHGGEHLVQRLDVVGHARDEPADRVAVEEAQGELLDVAEERRPQVEHGPLARDLQGEDVAVPDGQADDDEEPGEQRQPGHDPGEVAPRASSSEDRGGTRQSCLSGTSQ